MVNPIPQQLLPFGFKYLVRNKKAKLSDEVQTGTGTLNLVGGSFPFAGQKRMVPG